MCATYRLLPKFFRFKLVVVWRGISSKTDWKDQGRGFILLPPWPPNCLGQMLTVRDFGQHLVSSFKTIRSNTPWGARCMEHCEMMWSALCSLAPHSQFVRGTRSHLYMDEQKRLTPERKTVELDPSCPGQTHTQGSGASLGNESVE